MLFACQNKLDSIHIYSCSAILLLRFDFIFSVLILFVFSSCTKLAILNVHEMFCAQHKLNIIYIIILHTIVQMSFSYNAFLILCFYSHWYRCIGRNSNMRKCARNVTTIQIIIHNSANWVAIYATLLPSRGCIIATPAHTTFSPIRYSRSNGTWWVEYVFVLFILFVFISRNRILTQWIWETQKPNGNIFFLKIYIFY